MADIVHFTPKVELSAAQNVAAFVEVARDHLTVFGADLVFDEMVWRITETNQQRGLTHEQRITFAKYSTLHSDSPEPMGEPFGSFAKAYVRYMQGLRSMKNPQNRMAALRLIEHALTENGLGADVVRIDAHVLDRAAQLVRQQFSEAGAYRIGGQIEMIASLLAEKRFTAAPLEWANSIPRPSDTTRVGKEADERRAEKMPSDSALNAVAIAFRLATVPRDVIAVSAAAIMCSAPDRIGEVLTLPVECEVRQPRSGNKGTAYGFRWWPAKGANPMVKYLIPTMTTIAEEALSKIRRHTDAARKVAAWYEANPTRMYLPEEFEHIRRTGIVAFDEVTQLFGYVKVRQWANKMNIEILGERGAPFLDFNSVERAILGMLPNGFPVFDPSTGMKFSEALFVGFDNMFRIDGTPNRCMVRAINQQNITDRLGARISHGITSAFSALGLTEEDGSEIEITSHQFRHWLNTLAQRGGLSQLDIAKWSGRRDVRQNRAYDHMSEEEVLQLIRETVGADDKLYSAVVAFKVNAPVTRDEFSRMMVPTAHTTEIGFCVHDFAALPCQRFRDCMNCPEQVCIKGNAVRTARLKELLGIEQGLLANAEAAVEAGDYGADRWLEHQQQIVPRLKQLVAIMDDDSIPDGTVIRLAAPEDGPLLLERDRGKLDSEVAEPIALSHQQRQAALMDLRASRGAAD